MGNFQPLAIVNNSCRTFHGLLGLLVFRRQKGFQFGEQLGEDGYIGLELLHHALNDTIRFLVQRVALRHIVAVPDCRGGHAIEQLPRRMRTRGEKPLVQHRHLQHRDLQAADKGLHRIRDLWVFENVIEEHRDNVDGDRIELRQAFGERRGFDLVEKISRAGKNSLGIQRIAQSGEQAVVAALQAVERV